MQARGEGRYLPTNHSAWDGVAPMAEEKDIADVRPAGGRKKLIIISVAAVLLLLGAGGTQLPGLFL